MAFPFTLIAEDIVSCRRDSRIFIHEQGQWKEEEEGGGVILQREGGEGEGKIPNLGRDTKMSNQDKNVHLAIAAAAAANFCSQRAKMLCGNLGKRSSLKGHKCLRLLPG